MYNLGTSLQNYTTKDAHTVGFSDVRSELYQQTNHIQTSGMNGVVQRCPSQLQNRRTDVVYMYTY